MEKIKAYIVVVLYVALTLAGIYVKKRIARVILWILSVPFFLIGVLALLQGGLAEHMTSAQLFYTCLITFAPGTGCIIGEFKIASTKKNKKESTQRSSAP